LDLTALNLIDQVIGREGGYVNDPADPGGETNWGITKTTAVAAGYGGDMKDLTKSQAEQIYYDQYYVKPGFEAVGHVSLPIAAKLLDAGVNVGPKTASTWLQRSLNLCLRADPSYQLIGEDGVLGPASLNALNSLCAKRGTREAESLLLKCMNGFQFGHYVDVVANNPTTAKFFVGWVSQRIG
jgi:lysozyme family protein